MPERRGEPSARRVAIILCLWASKAARVAPASSGASASTSPEVAISGRLGAAMHIPVSLQRVAYLGGGDLAGGDVGERQAPLPLVGHHHVDAAAARPVVDTEALDLRPRNPLDGSAPADDGAAGPGPNHG